MEGKSLDLHSLLNSNHFLMTIVVPRNKKLLLLLRENGGDRFQIETTSGKFQITISDGRKKPTTLNYNIGLLGNDGGDPTIPPSTPILLIDIEHELESNKYTVSISNSSYRETKTAFDGPNKLSDQALTLHNIPHVQIIKNVPTNEYTNRIFNRGYIQTTRRLSDFSINARTNEYVFTERNISSKNGVSIVDGSPVSSSIHELQSNEIFTISGWFLPTITGTYTFLISYSDK